MANADNVTTGKPKIAGAIFRAPLGTTIPNDATSELNIAFKSLGYITEDGVNLDNSYSSDVIKAWGGDVVLTNRTDSGYAFGFSMMEHRNQEALKVAYGDENVKEEASSISIDATGEVGDSSVYVIERVTKGGKADRIIIPHGDVTAIGSVSYKDDDAIVYPVTIKPISTKVGDKVVHFKEYIEK